MSASSLIRKGAFKRAMPLISGIKCLIFRCIAGVTARIFFQKNLIYSSSNYTICFCIKKPPFGGIERLVSVASRPELSGATRFSRSRNNLRTIRRVRRCRHGTSNGAFAITIVTHHHVLSDRCIRLSHLIAMMA